MLFVWNDPEHNPPPAEVTIPRIEALPVLDEQGFSPSRRPSGAAAVEAAVAEGDSAGIPPRSETRNRAACREQPRDRPR